MIIGHDENQLTMRDEDLKRIFFGLPNEYVLVGGYALAVWAELLELKFKSSVSNVDITTDIDIFGKFYLLECIADKWNANSYPVSDLIDSTLIGQVIKRSVEPDGYRVVDIIGKVFGLDKSVFYPRKRMVPYKGTNIGILHPLDLLRARVENVNGIEKKQTQHNADQICLAIDILEKYLEVRLDFYLRDKDPKMLSSVIKDIHECISMANDMRLQGTAKAWNLDLMAALPIKKLNKAIEIPEIKELFDTKLPEAISIATKIPRLSNIGAPKTRTSTSYKV